MSFNFSPKVVTDGLVLYLDAANTKSYVSGSTTWNDLSRSQTNTTLINGPTFDSANGGSIVFDGVNDRVQLNNSIIDSISTVSTVSCWLYRTTIYDTNNNSAQGIFGVYENDTNRSGIYFSADGGHRGKIGSLLILGGVLSGRVYTQQTSWPIGWYNIVATRTPSNYKIYVNGVDMPLTVVSNTATIAFNTNPTQIAIGTLFFGGSFGNHLLGNLSNLSIYNKTLTPQEIQQNYNATKTRYGL